MEKKTSKNILLAIMGGLIILEIAYTVYSCIFCKDIASLVYYVLVLIALIGVALYGFWLYKKPHGNMLKYTMCLFALSVVISTLVTVYEWGDPFAESFPPILAACLIFYVSGRLNRIDQNKCLMPIIVLILLVSSIIEMVSISDPSWAIECYHTASRFLITFLTLMIAYFVRFKEHREAGLTDTPKK